jgi:hypothetical protein
MFFQLFLGGITLKMMPSENGSMLSTNSSSAFPPRVIIYPHEERKRRFPRQGHQNTNLVHLLQFQRNQTKARHELVQTLFPEIIISLFLCVTRLGDLIEVFGATKELLLALLIIPEHRQIRLGVFQFFYRREVNVKTWRR